MGSQVAIPLWATAMWLRCPGKVLHRRRDLVIGRFWGGMQLGLSENDIKMLDTHKNLAIFISSSTEHEQIPAESHHGLVISTFHWDHRMGGVGGINYGKIWQPIGTWGSLFSDRRNGVFLIGVIQLFFFFWCFPAVFSNRCLKWCFLIEKSNNLVTWKYLKHQTASNGGFQSHGGTPVHHPYFRWIFHEINQWKPPENYNRKKEETPYNHRKIEGFL